MPQTQVTSLDNAKQDPNDSEKYLLIDQTGLSKIGFLAKKSVRFENSTVANEQENVNILNKSDRHLKKTLICFKTGRRNSDSSRLVYVESVANSEDFCAKSTNNCNCNTNINNTNSLKKKRSRTKNGISFNDSDATTESTNGFMRNLIKYFRQLRNDTSSTRLSNLTSLSTASLSSTQSSSSSLTSVQSNLKCCSQ